MPKYLHCALLALSFLLTAATNARPQVPLYSATEITERCQQAIDVAQAEADRLAALPVDQASVQTILQPWDDMSAASEDIISPIYLLTYVHPDKAVRDAGEACINQATAFETALYQNVALYQRVAAVKAEQPQDQKLRKDLLDSFIDTGVNLSDDKRLKASEILQQIQALSQEFSRNLRDNPARLTFSKAEQAGLPEAYLARVNKDEQGNLVLGFDYPDFVPFMTHAENGAARQRYYRGFLNRGTPRNLEILNEVVQLRHTLAGLHDMDSYAHLVTQRNMVQTPQTVLGFLDEVATKVREAERNDIEQLKTLKAAHLKLPADKVRVRPWDKEFYLERLRRSRYDINQAELRKYFPTQVTLEWILAISSELYGLRFSQRDVPVWHDDVLYYDVYDQAKGHFIGGIYLDLYPREGKYGHAAAFPVRGASTRLERTPISVLVTNFNREGLTLREVETFLHEFGHVLHGVLSTTHYVNHAGTSVERDFVEAPSQMYEAWARNAKTLQMIRHHCEDCPVIDDNLAARLEAARKLGSGLRYARQHLYASYDMALAGPQPGKVLEVWRAMEGATPLGYAQDTAFPGTFGHIAGGYAAGYYGYMWSEALALDMLSRFGDDLMNASVGRQFRAQILARGGSLPGGVLVRNFLGRETSPQAFFREIGGD